MTLKEIKIQLALGSLSIDMKLKLTCDPNTPVEALTILSTDKDMWIRGWIANNPNTPVEALTILSTDKDYYVRYYVACNPNTPIEVLTILSRDEDSYVRWKAASNFKIRKC